MNPHMMTPNQLRAWAQTDRPGLESVTLAVRQLFKDYDAARARCKEVLDREANLLRREHEVESLKAGCGNLIRENERLRKLLNQRGWPIREDES